MSKRDQMMERLKKMADHSYKEFNDRILNAPTVPTLGIRVPALRKLAKETAGDPKREWLDEMVRNQGTCYCQEEHMLFGMTSGYRKGTREEHAALLDAWVPGIVSWADCDCGTSTFQWMKKDQEFWFSYIKKWLESTSEFEVRFGVIALMDFFLNDRYIDEVLRQYKEVQQKEYYVRMGIAWGIATAYVQYPEKVLALLREKTLDSWTHNKAIQKCRESRRISPHDKDILNTLKRRGEKKDGEVQV